MKKILIILTFCTSIVFGISGAIDIGADEKETNSTTENNDMQEVSIQYKGQ